METKKVAFEIEVKGTENQAKRLNEIEVELAQINKTRKKLLDLQKNNLNIGKDEEDNLAKLTSKTKALGIEKNKVTKEINNTIKSANAAAGSYNELAERNVKLAAKIKALGDVQGKNKKEFQSLTKEYNDNNNKLKEMDASMGNHQRNVGNYTGAIKDAFRQTGFFSKEMMMAQQAMNLMKVATAGTSQATSVWTKVLKILKVALISTGIGAVVVALGSLMAYFKSTGERATQLKNAMAPLKVFFENLKDIIIGVGETIYKAFSNIKNFWSEIGSGFRKTSEQLKGLMDETRREAELLRWINNLKQQIVEEDIAFTTERVRLEARLRELMAQAKDDQYTFKQRLSFQQEALKLTDEILKKEQKLARERLAAMAAENSISTTSDEARKEQAELEAEIIQKEVEYYKIRKEMITYVTNLKKQANDELKKELEYRKALADLTLDTKQYSEIESAITNMALRTTATESYQAEQRLDIRKKEVIATLQLYAMMSGEISSILGQHTAAYQVLASAEALINAYAAINKTMKEPLLPWPSNIIMSGIIGAKALANVASINKIQFASGGMVPSGYQLPGMPANGDNTLAMLQPGEVVLNKHQQNKLGGARTFKSIGVPGFADGGLVPPTAPVTTSAPSFDMAQLSSAISRQRVEVLEADITRAQKTVKVIESLSNF